MDFFGTIMAPFKWLVSVIMVGFHDGLSFIGLPAANGWTWTLSIIGLVLVIRAALIPVFVKQIKAQRGMQLLQPDLKKMQDKYKGKTDQLSRQAMAQEQMALYKKHGTNPFSACLPMPARPAADVAPLAPGGCPPGASLGISGGFPPLYPPAG
jgi:YidC/Oxa1 family membrane protein insertase